MPLGHHWGPRGTQMPAGRREAVPGGSGSGRQPSSMGSRGIKRPSFWKSSTQIFSVVGGRVNDVPDRIVASGPITATPAGQSVVTSFDHDLAAKNAVGVLGPTAETHTEQGRRDAGLKRAGKCEEPSTGPGTRFRQRCSRRWRSKDPGSSKCRQTFASILVERLF